MAPIVGIRREDKSEWERRVPIIPAHVQELKEKHGIVTVVQPSRIRIFPDEAFSAAGADVREDLSDCQTIFAIKEIPVGLLKSRKAYVFFSHTIKGQAYNMPMLKKMMDQECHIIDYERICDERGKRLVAFGRFAGIAGMLDTLWAFGKRLSWKGIDSPFGKIKRAYEYRDSHEAKQHIGEIGEQIRRSGFGGSLKPIVCGFTGYGNVSQGAQEIFDCLQPSEITPQELLDLSAPPCKTLCKVVFKEEHFVKPVTRRDFDLMDYYRNPEHYRSYFHSYIPHLTILMNCIYWEEKYPRLLTRDYLRDHFPKTPKLEIIGDISCDIGGSMECTVKATEPEQPVFVFEPDSGSVKDGYCGNGVVIMAVDNLPCEMPAEASNQFSKVLMPFIPEIAHADYSTPFDRWNVSHAIKGATILYCGKLTKKYDYLNQYL